MKEKKKGMPLDAVVVLVLMLFVLALALEGLVRQELPKEATGFPLFVFAVIFAVGCLELFRIWRGQKMDPQKTQKKVFHNRKNFLMMCGLIVGYIVLMCLVGFIISTIVFAIVFAVKFRYKHPLVFGAAAVLVTIGLYYLFRKVMYIQLPVGYLTDMIL